MNTLIDQLVDKIDVSRRGTYWHGLVTFDAPVADVQLDQILPLLERTGWQNIYRNRMCDPGSVILILLRAEI